MTIKDHNESRTFHPSLDIKDGVLVLGFRLKKEDGKEVDIYITKVGGILLVSDKTEFNIDDNTKISIDKKKRLLAKLSQKWSDDGLNKYIESFNNPLGRQISGNALFNKIKDNFKLYIELENDADYSILTAWCIGTYSFPIFSAYPYIHIKAPKSSGKSQCLNFIREIAFNAVKARASLPALRDTVDALRGTYIMDQADSLCRNNNEDLLDILTDSYKRGGGNTRKMIVNKKDWNVEEFDAYSPKAFGSINQLPEDLRDRCIVVPLIKSKKNHPQIDEEKGIWKEIRGELYVILLNNFQYMYQIYTLKQMEYKNNAGVLGRQLELWLPIETVLSIVDASQEEIETSKKRFLSRYEFASYQTSEIELAVIDTIILLMKEKIEMVLRPKEIAERIDTDLFEDDDKFSFASKKLKSTIVGRAISKFNLAVNKLPRDNQGERYLFNKAQLQKIHNSYFNKDEELDTQTYTKEKIATTQDIFSDTKSVT